MRIGCCIGSNLWRAEHLKEYGYDFAELCVKDFGEFNESQYVEYAEKVKQLGIPCEAANCFIPGSIRLNRLEADYDVISDYLKLSAKRASEIGVRTIVFGSGGARKCPEGLSIEDCTDDIKLFLSKYAGPEMAKYGIRIAIEPLASIFCNTITSVKQAVKIMDDVGLDNIFCLADNYHMDIDKEDISSLSEYKGKIIHGHISSHDPTRDIKRAYPKRCDGYDKEAFLSSLMQSGCEACSIEADTTDETFKDDAREAIIAIKEAIKKGLK